LIDGSNSSLIDGSNSFLNNESNSSLNDCPYNQSSYLNLVIDLDNFYDDVIHEKKESSVADYSDLITRESPLHQSINLGNNDDDENANNFFSSSHSVSYNNDLGEFDSNDYFPGQSSIFDIFDDYEYYENERLSKRRRMNY
jgi:hypothetical protein